MRIKLFILFFVFFPLAYAITYSPGQKIDIPYHNISDVSGYCVLKNDSLYINANIPLGEHDCEFTYLEEDINKVSSGSGGGSAKIKKVGIGNVTIKIDVLANPKIETKYIDRNHTIYQDKYIDHDVYADPIVTTIETKTNKIPLFMWIVVFILIVGLGLTTYIIYQRGY